MKFVDPPNYQHSTGRLLGTVHIYQYHTLAFCEPPNPQNRMRYLLTALPPEMKNITPGAVKYKLKNSKYTLQIYPIITLTPHVIVETYFQGPPTL